MKRLFCEICVLTFPRGNPIQGIFWFHLMTFTTFARRTSLQAALPTCWKHPIRGFSPNRVALRSSWGSHGWLKTFTVHVGKFEYYEVLDLIRNQSGKSTIHCSCIISSAVGRRMLKGRFSGHQWFHGMWTSSDQGWPTVLGSLVLPWLQSLWNSPSL